MNRNLQIEAYYHLKQTFNEQFQTSNVTDGTFLAKTMVRNNEI